ERDVGWFVRQRIAGAYRKQRIGTPDDGVKADGDVVLSYRQAVERAVTLQLEDRQPLPRHYGDGLTINQVVTAYFEEHLAGKGSEYDSKRSWALHGADSIGKRLVAATDAPALRKWHRALAAKPPTRRGKVLEYD